MIVFHIKGQELSVVQPTIVSDTIDYLTARFVFKTSEWDGLQKWAHFAKDNVSYDILLSEDEIKKNQHLNLSDGTWNVYLHGMAVEDGDIVERITTETVNISVKKSGVLSGQPFPDVPASAAEQIFAAAQEAIDVANSVRDDADSGEFDGVDGADAKINGYNTVNIVAGENVEIKQSDNTLTISSTGGGGGGGTSDHRQLSNRDAANQHPISAITGLQDELDAKADADDIPAEVTESTVAEWGFTKNTGTYSKPSTGIPKSDLASAVQTSLGKADSALQSVPSTYRTAATQDAIDAGKQDTISDLETIRSGAALGATAVQPEAGKGLFSGSYDDLTDKPTIPQPITEYLKSASVSGNTLNLTKQDDSTLSFTPQGGGGGDTWHFIRSVTASTEHIDQNVSYVTDENGNVCGFTFDKDADGNTFSYKDIAAVGILKSPQNSGIAYFVGEITDNITLASFRGDLADAFRAFRWRTETIGAKRYAYGEYCTQYASNAIRFAPNYLANSAGFINPQNFMNYVPDAGQVDKISAYTGATTVYVEGIIYFYGKN